MIIQPARVMGGGCVFRQDFMSRRSVQDAGGVLVGCTVGNGGVSPTATSSRITYGGTEALLGGSAQMTLALRFKTASVLTASCWVSKADSLFTTTQWTVELSSGLMIMYVGTTNYFLPTNALVAGTEYLAHCVYNGGLAAGSRGLMYLNGGVVATTIGGTLPTTQPISQNPVTVFNRFGGTGKGPNADAVLRSFRIYNTAWSAEECLDDFQQDAYSEVWS